jgi:hypothetical protein
MDSGLSGQPGIMGLRAKFRHLRTKLLEHRPGRGIGGQIV